MLSHMPIIVTMAIPHELDQPGSAAEGHPPEADQPTEGAQEGITPERLTKIIRKMESGFYDTPEVREHMARRVREELGP